MSLPTKFGRRLHALLLTSAFAGSGTCATENAVGMAAIREPAVAGLFYPRDRLSLSQEIDSCLASARVESIDNLKALVCPHAGCTYSGPVAASAYRQLTGREFRTVIIMAPSHYAALPAASVSAAAAFRTPLGDVPISAKARVLATLRPFSLEPPCLVQRPGWWRQSSRSPPAVENANTWEHSDEVQLPFLQRTLGNFEVLPIVFGEVDPVAAANALVQILDDQTLLVASSDLSHYHRYATAQALDQGCVKAISELDIPTMESQEACGRIPILTLMHVAKQRGWRARLLDCRNSGDITGDKTRVVGYAAVVFYEPSGNHTDHASVAPTVTYSTDERRFLLTLARKAVREAANTGKLPAVDIEFITPNLSVRKGCFVTLTKAGLLRGCIGHIIAQEPLYRAVLNNALHASINDPRFQPVSADEVDKLEIEISVLTDPLPLFFSSVGDLLGKLHPHKDGVVLQIGGRSATYLPQVWEQLPDKIDFLNSLAEKAGCEPSAWRQKGTTVSIYHVESFKESDY